MKSEVLAYAGDEVKIISDYNNVVIVDNGGNRFSVKKDNLKSDKREGAPVVAEVKEAKRTIKNAKASKPELF